jgi:hypothetical protein
MNVKDLYEVKKQIEELLEKGFICRARPLGELQFYLWIRKMVQEECVLIIVV